MAWRLAKSLVKLRDQVDDLYPNRSTASDGTLGDSAHASRPSDHNPNPQGVVCGLDLTHDPDSGFDAHALADNLRKVRHPTLKYLISNGRIASSKRNWLGIPWQWRKFTGAPHDRHIHISVGVGPDGSSRQPYDDTTPWAVGKPTPVAPPTIKDLGVIMKSIVKEISFTVDDQGNGWVKIPHNEKKNPIYVDAITNGNRPAQDGGYPDIGTPIYLTSAYSGNHVIVTIKGAKPRSTFGIKVRLDFA